MDRKSFIKKLTAAAIGIVVAKPIIDALPTSHTFTITFDKPWKPYITYPLTYKDVFWVVDEEVKKYEDIINTPYLEYHDKELL